MTIPERKSNNKKRAIILLVKNGEMSVAYALYEIERLNDEGKLLDSDYEEVLEFLDSLMPVEDAQTEENASYTEEDAEMPLTEVEESTEEAE